MNKMRPPFESEYLKRKVLKVRTRQQAGEIIVATTEGLWPLPLMGAVPNLQRRGRETVCEWGSFVTLHDSYHVARFIPADGQLPLAWKEYEPTPIELATVCIDTARRWARVISDETGAELAILTHVPAWESGWQLLEKMREELARARVPAVPWRVEWAEGQNGERPLWPGRSPTVHNDHAAVNLAGYAYDDDGNLVYLSAVGHKTALEAIRASLLGRHRQRKLILGGRYRQYLNGLDRYEQLWAPLADFQAHHLVLVARPALKPEPTDAVTYLVVFDGDGEPEEQATRLLTKRLHEALPIPVLDEWAAALWNAAQEQDWITQQLAGGDCRGCWMVSLTSDWAALIERLIAQGEIEIAIE